MMHRIVIFLFQIWIKSCCVFSFILFLHFYIFAYLLYAVPPMDFDFQGKDPSSFCNYDREAYNNNALRFHQSSENGFYAFKPRTTLISSQTYRILFLQVEFSDTSFEASYQVSAFTDGLKDYYYENSYGRVQLEITTVSVTVSKTYDHYANGTDSLYDELFEDAFLLIPSPHAYLLQMDHVILMHAGYGAETAESLSDDHIHSVYKSWVTNFDVVDDQIRGTTTFRGVVFVPSKEFSGISSLGVICHEYGHQLGLPDLYDTGKGESVVGFWSLMDAGSYTGNGENPAHLDAWSKYFLGYSNPQRRNIEDIQSTQQTTSPQNHRLEQSVDNSTGSLILESENSSIKEFFLLEYRNTKTISTIKYDKELPGSGMLIWRINSEIHLPELYELDNNVNHTGVRWVTIIPQDGTDPTQTFNDSRGDVWTDIEHVFKDSKLDTNYQTGLILDRFIITDTTISFRILGDKIPIVRDAKKIGKAVQVTTFGGGWARDDNRQVYIYFTHNRREFSVNCSVYSSIGALVTRFICNNSNTQFHTDGNNSDIVNTCTWTVHPSMNSGVYMMYFRGSGIDAKKKFVFVK